MDTEISVPFGFVGDYFYNIIQFVYYSTISDMNAVIAVFMNEWNNMLLNEIFQYPDYYRIVCIIIGCKDSLDE